MKINEMNEQQLEKIINSVKKETLRRKKLEENKSSVRYTSRFENKLIKEMKDLIDTIKTHGAARDKSGMLHSDVNKKFYDIVLKILDTY